MRRKIKTEGPYLIGRTIAEGIGLAHKGQRATELQAGLLTLSSLSQKYDEKRKTNLT